MSYNKPCTLQRTIDDLGCLPRCYTVSNFLILPKFFKLIHQSMHVHVTSLITFFLLAFSYLNFTALIIRNCFAKFKKNAFAYKHVFVIYDKNMSFFQHSFAVRRFSSLSLVGLVAIRINICCFSDCTFHLSPN